MKHLVENSTALKVILSSKQKEFSSKMQKKKPLSVTYRNISTEMGDADERINRAFDILFGEILKSGDISLTVIDS